MAAKKTISVRVPDNLHRKVDNLSKQAGMSLTDLVTEALATYCGQKLDSVPDRLTRLEDEMAWFKRKFSNFWSSD
ncbi:MAG: CopG family transcriptional regulator [Cyanothece sp. SIO1E1]|nr:CopG family transcriptional regulator [Cyanothece sp. SIO1E1]